MTDHVVRPRRARPRGRARAGDDAVFGRLAGAPDRGHARARDDEKVRVLGADPVRGHARARDDEKVRVLGADPVRGHARARDDVGPTTPVRRSRARREVAGERERGSVALETVIVFPVVMVLIWGALQLGLWAYGKNVCQATAEQAAAAGAPLGSDAGVALRAGQEFADGTGHGLLENATVRVVRTASQITVVVEADVLAVAPGFPSHISQVATLPIERRT